ncbi:MAG: hypothetical protein ACREMY_32035, partial [bacterium]
MGSGGSPDWASLIPEEELPALANRIVASCVQAGLSRPDAEDVAQDVWIWLVESNNLAMITLAPWLSSVLDNFLKRFFRRRWKASRVFVPFGNHAPQYPAPRTTEPTASEARLFLERLAVRSPRAERHLVEFMSAG